ncbi:MxaK protein [Methylomonas sp. MED-D]|uniref:MxaK protein n=1 Tax=unclassified Methylomonas TaxID=2608980 RepID=UPI0028A3E3C5|nr:MxaK protein [Methylomonas sp. MV1]MDT4331582.1 MxaK protein [Methylomonas sp. MV1]
MRGLTHGLLWAGLLTALLVGLVQGARLYRLAGQNQLIEQLLAGRDVEIEDLADAPPSLRMARAVYLRKAGRYDDALATLNVLLRQAPPALQAQARYNLGNLYMAQAQEKLHAGNINDATPLVGLAKQAYRDALIAEPGYWDAKYNLEVAMRLLPEMDRVNSGHEPDDGREKTQLWTTLPGFPRGLP